MFSPPFLLCIPFSPNILVLPANLPLKPVLPCLVLLTLKHLVEMKLVWVEGNPTAGVPSGTVRAWRCFTHVLAPCVEWLSRNGLELVCRHLPSAGVLLSRLWKHGPGCFKGSYPNMLSLQMRKLRLQKKQPSFLCMLLGAGKYVSVFGLWPNKSEKNN